MISKPLVSVAAKNGPYQNVVNALNQLDLSSLKDKRILIKPNVGRIAPPESGYNTNPEAVAALIDVLRNLGAADVAIGESPIVGVDVMEAFQRAGFVDMAKKYQVELIDFNSKPPIKKQIPNPRILTETRICQQVYDFDVLISVPVTKTHMHTGVTLGIKNLKGCLYRHEKVRYHQLEYLEQEYPEKTLDSAISDLATILLPDMVVVDGYVGMQGLGPSGGEAIKSDFAIASFDPMAADAVACQLMGLNAEDVPHLRIISERNGLAIKVEEFHILPADYVKFAVPYQKPPTKISVQFPNVEVQDKESCSSCLSTLMMFLKRFGEDMSQYPLCDGKFHIAIGKGVEDAMDGTVFVGNCTRHMKDKGIHVKGCPPVPTRIYEAIVHQEPDKNEDPV